MPDLPQFQTNPTKVPVVLVPGFMASNLERPGKGLLRPPLPVWPVNVYILAAQLRALRNQTPLKANGLVGNYYDGLLEFITCAREQGGLGRTLDEDFWIFAYDWRQSCHYSGQKLAEFIGAKLTEANTRRIELGLPPCKKVDIINHSMGGFVTRSAIKEFGAPVRRVVYIASGHYGFTKAYFALHPRTTSRVLDDFVKDFIPGWYWDLLKVLPNIWFLQGWLAKLLRTLPAMYELLPDQYYLEEPPALVLDAIQSPPQPVTGLKESYFRHGWRFPTEMQARVRAAMQFKERLGRDLPGRANLEIYATTLPTYAQVQYRRRFGAIEKLPLGDKTVTAPSINRAQGATQVIIEAAHTQLPNLPDTHKAIRKFLNRK